MHYVGVDQDGPMRHRYSRPLFDVVKHLFGVGTSPIAMHEYIVRDSSQDSPGGIATIDLGYVLV
jgi:hypothetical protein